MHNVVQCNAISSSLRSLCTQLSSTTQHKLLLAYCILSRMRNTMHDTYLKRMQEAIPSVENGDQACVPTLIAMQVR
jgi:hypothetical protein